MKSMGCCRENYNFLRAIKTKSWRLRSNKTHFYLSPAGIHEGNSQTCSKPKLQRAVIMLSQACSRPEEKKSISLHDVNINVLNDNQLKHLWCLVNVSVVPEPQRTSVRHHLHLYSGNPFQALTFCVLRGSLSYLPSNVQFSSGTFFISWICPCSTEEKLTNPNLHILNDI